jgi:hypothetical protein
MKEKMKTKEKQEKQMEKRKRPGPRLQVQGSGLGAVPKFRTRKQSPAASPAYWLSSARDAPLRPLVPFNTRARY